MDDILKNLIKLGPSRLAFFFFLALKAPGLKDIRLFLFFLLFLMATVFSNHA